MDQVESRNSGMGMRLLLSLLLLSGTLCGFGAVPSYTVFRGTGGIFITTNPPTGLIIIDGSGIFTSSGTNATISTSTNGVLVAVASTNINFIKGTNVVLTATNIGSVTHIGFHVVPTTGLPAPPLNSVQFNSNGVMQGSADFVFVNGVATVGQGFEITTGSLVLNGGTTALVAWNGLGHIRWDADGVARLNDDASLSFNRLNLGGTDAGFPAIGRTNGDLIVLGANGGFGAVATNRLHVPGGIVLTNANVAPGKVWTAVGGLGGGTWSNVTASGSSSVAPPISSVQFNSNGVQQGSANFTFTNNQVYINNPGAVGSAQLTLANTTQAAEWDLAISSNPEVYLLGIRNGATFSMVWEPAGNVGIGTTNPASRLDVAGRVGISPDGIFATNALDVSGHTSLRSNLFLANIPSNAAPVAFLATDAAGEVFETAVPTGGSSSSDTNAVLTNLVGTVGRNVTNVVSLSTSNATSKPLTNSYTGGVLTVFGVEAGANVTVTPNGSNLVIAATSGGTPGGNSAAIQFNQGGAFAGTNTLVFDRTNNRVGIGTASPEQKLSIGGSVGSPATYDNAGAVPMLTLTANMDSGNNFLVTGDIAAKVGGTDAASGGSQLRFITQTRDATGISVTRMLINRLGNVGIGTITPAFSLDVTGRVAMSSAIVSNHVAFWPTTGSGPRMYAGFLDGTFSGGVPALGTNFGFASLAANVTGGWSLWREGPYGTETWNAVSNFNVGGSVQITNNLFLPNITSNASPVAVLATDAAGRVYETVAIANVPLANNFLAMGITNIVAADSGIVIRTNAGSLTISNTVAAGGGTTPPGNSNQIPFLNVAGTAYMYAGYSSLTNPGFGFSPSGPQAGYGGLMVFSDVSHGLVTIGHPNPASDLATFATAFAVSNRYNGTGFKQEMSKYDAVDVGSGSDPISTFVTYRTWSGSTPTIAAEIRKDGMGFFSHGTMFQSNSLASTMPTAAELGPGGIWVGNSNASLVAIKSANGTTTAMTVLVP